MGYMYQPLFPAQVSGEGVELMLSMRGLKKCCETLPSSQGMTTEHTNSQQLWLPAQDPAHQYATHTQGKKTKHPTHILAKNPN